MRPRLFRPRNAARALLDRHFGPAVVDRLVAAGRTFPIMVGPLQHDEIDVGEPLAARCLRRGLWLARSGETPFAVLLAPGPRNGFLPGLHVEISVPPGDGPAALSRAFLEELETLVRQTGSYRGKVLSLEAGAYSGLGGSVRVHRLHPVAREEVILPEATLRLLERNVHGFLRQRDRLHALGLAVKKGLLFYGPPGTGKTHTIHYLAQPAPRTHHAARHLGAGRPARHEPPGPARGGAGRAPRAHRPGHRVPAPGRAGPAAARRALRARRDRAGRRGAGDRPQDGQGQPGLHQGADAAVGPVPGRGERLRRAVAGPRRGRARRDALRRRQPNVKLLGGAAS